MKLASKSALPVAPGGPPVVQLPALLHSVLTAPVHEAVANGLWILVPVDPAVTVSPAPPSRRAIASHASCSTGFSPAGGVRFSACAVRVWRALNPAISRPPTRWRLAEN